MSTPSPYKVMERSIFSSRCFLENMKRTNMIRNVEVEVLERWYDWCLENTSIRADLIGTCNYKLSRENIFIHSLLLIKLCIFSISENNARSGVSKNADTWTQRRGLGIIRLLETNSQNSRRLAVQKDLVFFTSASYDYRR